MKIAGLCLLPQAREPSLHPTAEARWVLRVLRLSRFYKKARSCDRALELLSLKLDKTLSG